LSFADGLTRMFSPGRDDWAAEIHARVRDETRAERRKDSRPGSRFEHSGGPGDRHMLIRAPAWQGPRAGRPDRLICQQFAIRAAGTALLVDLLLGRPEGPGNTVGGRSKHGNAIQRTFGAGTARCFFGPQTSPNPPGTPPRGSRRVNLAAGRLRTSGQSRPAPTPDQKKRCAPRL